MSLLSLCCEYDVDNDDAPDCNATNRGFSVSDLYMISPGSYSENTAAAGTTRARRAAQKLQTFFDNAHMCIYLHNKIAEICKVTEPEQTHFCSGIAAVVYGGCVCVYYANVSTCECVFLNSSKYVRRG